MTSLVGNLLKRLWPLLAALIIIYASLIIVGRELLPVINHYQPQINDFLSDKLGIHFNAGRFEGRWDGNSPVLGLNDLTIAPQEDAIGALTIANLQAEFNLPKSIAGLNPVWRALTVSEVSLSARENATGQWSLAGFPLGQGGGRDLGILADMLFDSRFIGVERVQLQIQFFSGVEATLHLVDLEVENSGDFHRARAHLKMGENQEEAATLIIEGRGDPRDEDFNASGYVKLSRINFDTVLYNLARQWFPEQVERVGEIDTAVDLSFWFDWRDSSLVNGRGVLNAEELPLNWLADVNSLHDVHANITGWYQRGQDWGVQLQGLDARWGDEIIEPVDVQFRQRVGRRWTEMQVATDHLDLDVLNPILQQMNLLPEKTQQMLAAFSPRGSFHNLWLDINLTSHLPVFTLRANVEELAVGSWRGSPAARGIKGYIEAGLEQGFVELDSPSGFAMHFPQAYEDFMPFGATLGRVDWRWYPEESRVRVFSGPISIEGEEGQGSAHLALNLGTRKGAVEPEMTLMVSMRDSHTRLLPRYLPKVLSPDLRNWLDNAVGEGDLPEVGFIWRGSLLKSNIKGRTIQLYARIKGGNLDYQQGWPALSDLSAQLVLDDGKLDVWTQGGDLGQARLLAANATLRPAGGGQLLGLTGKVTAPSGYATQVLVESPLHARLGDLKRWSLTGNSAVDLTLAIPLGGADQALAKYNVDATLEETSLALPGTDLAIKGVEGKVSYTLEKGLFGRNLKGTFLGNPLSASIKTDNVETRVDIGGTVTAVSLQPYLGNFAPHLQGASPIAGVLHLPVKQSAKQPFLDLTSHLAGMVVTLPAPLSKSATEKQPLEARLTFSENSTQVDAVMGSLASASWEMADGGFSRGQLDLLGEGATLPAEAGLLITGDLPAIDWTQWSAVLGLDKTTKTDGGTGAGSVATVEASATALVETLAPRLDLTMANLKVAGNDLGKTSLNGYRSATGWSLLIGSHLLGGKVLIPAASTEPLVLDLEYLHLPAVEEKAATGESRLDRLVPHDIPQMVFSVADLQVGETAYGRLGFRSSHVENGVRFSQVSGELQGIKLGIQPETGEETSKELVELTWLQSDGGDRTYFSGALLTSSLGELFTNQGYEKPLDARHAAFFADVFWQGKPWEFSLPSISGYLRLDLEDGQFYKVTGSTTNTFFKLVSLVNFDTWLRRLRFDFSDLFAQGVSFDSVKGGLVMNQGLIEFDDPIVASMPSGKIRLLGAADLNRDWLDARLVATIPVGTNLPWVAGLLGGLPAAAGVYLTGKLFEKQVNQLSSISYQVTGPWDDPEMKVDKIFSDKTE